MEKLRGGIDRGAFRRVVLTAVLFIFAILIPLSAFGSSRIHAVALANGPAIGHEPKNDFGGDFSSDSIPANPDQPEESGKAPIGNSSVVEEEVKAFHNLVDLSHVLSNSLAHGERVDHAYEAWFYSVTHPPLTPPPNAG